MWTVKKKGKNRDFVISNAFQRESYFARPSSAIIMTPLKQIQYREPIPGTDQFSCVLRSSNKQQARRGPILEIGSRGRSYRDASPLKETLRRPVAGLLTIPRFLGNTPLLAAIVETAVKPSQLAVKASRVYRKERIL